MKRNHDRAPDKKAFSVALPKSLLSEIETVAEKESRNRNKQIEYFLKKAVSEWKRNNPQYHPDAESQIKNDSEKNETSSNEELPEPRTLKITALRKKNRPRVDN